MDALRVAAADVKVGVGEVLRQRPEARDEGGPLPTAELEVQQLDLDRIPGLGTLHDDRPEHAVDPRCVEARDLFCRGALGELPGGGVLGSKLRCISRGHRERGGKAAIPAEVGVLVVRCSVAHGEDLRRRARSTGPKQAVRWA